MKKGRIAMQQRKGVAEAAFVAAVAGSEAETLGLSSKLDWVAERTIVVAVAMQRSETFEFVE
jgi:hypothetical protein